ncbi:MAG: histidine kinase dimerization/phosphoacceptor domain -containing protein [Candidatus Magnetobacterium sp. LHC-1]|nr:PAS domain-containing protein [Nitrospirota bacterium]
MKDISIQTVKFFESVLSVSVDGILIVDESQNVIVVNDAFCVPFGYVHGDLLETNLYVWLERVDASLVQRWGRLISEVYLNGRCSNVEIAIPTKTGVEYFNVTASLLKQVQAQSVNVIISIWHNITALKQTEAALRQERDTLEVRVARRTAELAKANESLMIEIAQRKDMEKQIIRSLDEKVELLKEVHHRVKNNMQIICSLLMLQSSYIEDDKYKDMFRDSLNRIRSMALLHEKLCQSPDLANINIQAYILGLTNTIFSAYKVSNSVITLELDVDDIPFNIDTAMSCGLILTELISNSLRHAFPDNRQGTLKIALHRHVNGNFKLTVKDDGIGIPQGFDIREPNSLGLHLAVSMVENKFNGQIELKNNDGTEFCIIFKEILPQ